MKCFRAKKPRERERERGEGEGRKTQRKKESGGYTTVFIVTLTDHNILLALTVSYPSHNLPTTYTVNKCLEEINEIATVPRIKPNNSQNQKLKPR